MSTTVSTSKNVLSSDVEVKGHLKFAGELTFDGKLEGEIQTDGVLNLGDSAGRRRICVGRFKLSTHTSSRSCATSWACT